MKELYCIISGPYKGYTVTDAVIDGKNVMIAPDTTEQQRAKARKENADLYGRCNKRKVVKTTAWIQPPDKKG